MSTRQACKNEKMVSKSRIIRKPVVKPSEIGCPRSGLLLSKLRKLGKLSCPECQVVWQEPGPTNLSPIQDSCGHIKCRRCFIRNIVFNNNSCSQCYPEKPRGEEDALETSSVTTEDMPKLELMTTAARADAKKRTFEEFMRRRKTLYFKKQPEPPPPKLHRYSSKPHTPSHNKHHYLKNSIGPSSKPSSNDSASKTKQNHGKNVEEKRNSESSQTNADQEKTRGLSSVTKYFKSAKQRHFHLNLRSSATTPESKTNNKQQDREKMSSKLRKEDDAGKTDLGPTTCRICKESFGLAWAFDLHMKLHS